MNIQYLDNKEYPILLDEKIDKSKVYRLELLKDDTLLIEFIEEKPSGHLIKWGNDPRKVVVEDKEVIQKIYNVLGIRPLRNK